MTRLALSASRSVDIINFLATFPERSFSLSEIARATSINGASCHAVLAVLAESGFVSRSANQKSYFLGPALVALGRTALRGQPTLSRAIQAAERLASGGDVSVLLSAVIGCEILAVHTLDGPGGGGVHMQEGERLPLVAPIGVPFLAWSDRDAVDAWIARRRVPLDAASRDGLDNDLSLTRRRGFHVTLRGVSSHTTASLIAEMAASAAIADYRDEVSRLIDELGHHRWQPDEISDEETYDVLLISAPIFAVDGGASYNLCLGGFARPLSGAELKRNAEKLTRSCLEIMRAERAPSRTRERQPALAGG